jgi:formylglycine-generating enzyme required for sulfatase activity
MITNRVLRGGSWAECMRHAVCTDFAPGSHDTVLGFRPVAKAIPPDSARVARGGSWFSIARTVRCAIRGADRPALCYPFLGLRPVAKANHES